MKTRTLINNWVNSDKYKQLRQQLDEKKEQLMSFKIKIMDKDEILSKSEIIEITKLVKQFNVEFELSKDKEYNQDYAITILGSADEIFFEYTSRQVNWFFYLGTYLLKEEYEIAAELRDVIQIEESQFLYLLQEYRADVTLIDEEFIERALSVKERLYTAINSAI